MTGGWVVTLSNPTSTLLPFRQTCRRSSCRNVRLKLRLASTAELSRRAASFYFTLFIYSCKSLLRAAGARLFLENLASVSNS